MIPSEGWDTALIKYIKSRISIKIFLLTMLILMAVSGISYGFVAAFMPQSYSNSLNRTLAAKARDLAESLSGYSLENAASVIGEFSDANQSRVVLLNEKGEIVREWLGNESLVSEVTISSSVAEEEQSVTEGFAEESTTAESGDWEGQKDQEVSYGDTIGTVVEGGGSVAEEMEQQAMGHYEVAFKGSENRYTLFVFGSTRLVNQAVEALGQILPWMLLTVFGISLVISLFYSRYLSKPIRKLGAASDKMAGLDFSVRTEMKRTDELGTLSRSLDTMARNLDQALKSLRSANAKLKDEMEQERELEQRRMEFFAAASHELKTPVTILKGQIEGMEQNVGVYKDRDKYLARAREVTVTLQNMVQEILMISKMESCGFSLKKKELDLAELVRLQLADLTELFEQKNMKLEITLPDQCLCRADQALMETVVRNVLVNAVRYSPENERIRVNLYKEISCEDCQVISDSSVAASGPKDSALVILEIENTGVHIEEAEFSRVFDAFYRVDSSRNRKSGGSGLGLYIVRQILEQHGAEYEMQNSREGVLFRMKLPPENMTFIG